MLFKGKKITTKHITYPRGITIDIYNKLLNETSQLCRRLAVTDSINSQVMLCFFVFLLPITVFLHATFSPWEASFNLIKKNIYLWELLTQMYRRGSDQNFQDYPECNSSSLIGQAIFTLTESSWLAEVFVLIYIWPLISLNTYVWLADISNTSLPPLLCI